MRESEHDELLGVIIAGFEALGLEYKPIIHQDDSVTHEFKKKTKQSKPRTVEYSEEFKLLWEIKPNRDGNSKKEAYNKYRRKLKEGEQHSRIFAGVKRYADYVNATKTEFVYKLSNFIEHDHYLCKWDIPKEVTKLKLPFNDDELATFAQLHGLSQPPRGMGYKEYRQLLQREIADGK